MTDNHIKSIIFNLRYCPNAKAEYRAKWLAEYREATGKEWQDE